MIKYYVILYLIIAPLLVFGQETDSLMAVWSNANNADSIRVDTLHKVAWKFAFTNPDLSLILATKELNFVQKMELLKTLSVPIIH